MPSSSPAASTTSSSLIFPYLLDLDLGSTRVRIKALVDRFMNELQEALWTRHPGPPHEGAGDAELHQESEREFHEREAAWKAELSCREGLRQ